MNSKFDIDAPITDEELREAEALRAALEAGDTSHDDVKVAQALAAGMHPSPLQVTENERAFARAEAIENERARFSRKRRNRAFIATTVTFSAAAAVLLSLSIQGPSPAPNSKAFGTSTQSLFTEPFAQETTATTGRLDRIVEARGRALRYQRYHEWGVR